jgi:hypothetical protein
MKGYFIAAQPLTYSLRNRSDCGGGGGIEFPFWVAVENNRCGNYTSEKGQKILDNGHRNAATAK